MKRKSFRRSEMDFLAQHGEELLAYRGEWIAVDGDELIAHASTLAELLYLSRQAGHPHPLVTAVSLEPYTPIHCALQ